MDWADWCYFFMLYRILLILFLLIFSQNVSAFEVIAPLTGVQDEDTLSALIYGENTKIRLLNVDCFETRKNARARFQHQYYKLSYQTIYE